jgi:succinate dehydrogenase / fumarate reductase flavoprotein subunit
MVEQLEHDVLIVGGGVAGMRAAIEACKTADTALISKVHPLRSDSGAARGGINAAIGRDEAWESHWRDTVMSGAYLADQDACQVLTAEAPENIYELEHMGVLFSRKPDGRIATRPFGGEDRPRTCFVDDITGRVLLQTLYEQVSKHDVRVYDEFLVTDLIVVDNVCRGLVGMDLATGACYALRARAVILATGGAGRVFGQSANGLIATGDGMALAYRAGAPLQDMEFVAFHPTTLSASSSGKGALIDDGARREGGYLLNARGERFMARYAPDKLELAPWDVVARAEAEEIAARRGVNGSVLLDLRHLGAATIDERLPHIRALAVDLAGVDLATAPLPVRPGAHYTIGGVRCDLDGLTPLQGLYAAGEVACAGVHGATALGGNALLEAVVFGRRAGRAAAAWAGRVPLRDVPCEAARRAEQRRDAMLRDGGTERTTALRAQLHDVMNTHFGVYRTAAEMKAGLDRIRDLRARYTRIRIDDKGRIFNTALQEAYELGSLLELAEVIATGALNRQESRGVHARRDFPRRDDQSWLKHSLYNWNADGSPRITYAPVTITRFQPAERGVQQSCGVC